MISVVYLVQRMLNDICGYFMYGGNKLGFYLNIC